jgi:hypothetical protein
MENMKQEVKTKLTMVSVVVRGRRTTAFLNLPICDDGRVRYDFRELTMGIPRGITISPGS